jgi:hypothetical protein
MPGRKGVPPPVPRWPERRPPPTPPPLHAPPPVPRIVQAKLAQARPAPTGPANRPTAAPPIHWPPGSPGAGVRSRALQPMQAPVNRRAQGYHQQRMAGLSELDKVASFLLASNYSFKASPTKVSQGLIQMDCVAVVLIKDSYWMASNSQG